MKNKNVALQPLVHRPPSRALTALAYSMRGLACYAIKEEETVLLDGIDARTPANAEDVPMTTITYFLKIV